MEKKRTPKPPLEGAHRMGERDDIWSQMVLKDQLTTGQGYVSAKPQDDLLGKEGRTITDLRPAGTAWLDGRPVDVVSEGMFVEKGRTVKVLEVQGMRVLVRPVSEAEP